MDKFLEHPEKFIPGTKMLQPKIKSKDERHDLIAFMEHLSV